ncbi:MAG: arsenic efflux protein [Candidatus Bathyarchaeota archaeon]|nr:arsenic efflux protein [Candidatus Bathyarchaeota archaeon]
MQEAIISVLTETSKIILIVTILMIIIEFLELKFQNRIRGLVTKRPINQYIVASVLGSVPGCIDAFFIVSLYVHGLVGFGSLAAVMLATAGDDAFMMLTVIPDKALLIFAVCAFLGIVGGFLADKIASTTSLKTHQPCTIEVHEEDFHTAHFFREHVYNHVLKRHIPRMFVWIFFTLLAVDYSIAAFDLESAVSGMPTLILLVLAALVGVIPESGPHLIFLILYSRGMIPLSVLLVNTLSQDGHGLLPLISYSVKDTLYVQIFTTAFSLIVGILLFLFGF